MARANQPLTPPFPADEQPAADESDGGREAHKDHSRTWKVPRAGATLGTTGDETTLRFAGLT